jgi:hypothetical protein
MEFSGEYTRIDGSDMGTGQRGDGTEFQSICFDGTILGADSIPVYRDRPGKKVKKEVPKIAYKPGGKKEFQSTLQ